MSNQGEYRFAADHPTAAGHFPGNPVIPGAVLLDAVLQVVAGAVMPCEIRSAKFLHPVHPGDRLVIRWSDAAGGELRFDCAVEGRAVLTGSLRLGGGRA